MTIGSLAVNVVARTGNLVRGMNRARSAVKGFTVYAAGVVATAGGLLTLAVRNASDAAETMSKFDVVFGGRAKAVSEFASTVATATNRSKHELYGFLAGFQDLFVPMGATSQQAEVMSRQLTQLAIDLGSFNNMNDADVVRDLMAAMTGSGEVMKKYGVIVSESAVKQELLNSGLDPKQATEAQKAFARLEIIMRGTTAAQGDAVRTAEGFANQVKGLKSELYDLSVEVGSQILPTITPFVSMLREAVSATTDATAGAGLFSKGLALIGDVVHTVRLAFVKLQAVVTGVFAWVVRKITEVVSFAVKSVNKLPGVEIDEPELLNALADELEGAAVRLNEKFEKLLISATPSERMARQGAKAAIAPIAAAASAPAGQLPQAVQSLFARLGGGIASLTGAGGPLASAALGAGGRLGELLMSRSGPQRYASLAEIQSEDRLLDERSGRNEPIKEVAKGTNKLVELFTEVRDSLVGKGTRAFAGLQLGVKVNKI